MRWEKRLSTLLIFLCAGALAAPQGTVKLPSLYPRASTAPSTQTAADIRAATTPLSAKELRLIIHRQHSLADPLNQATTAASMTVVPAGEAATAMFPSPDFQLAPCDWDRGVWLTYQHPLAAPTWPSKQYALVSMMPALLPGRVLEAKSLSEVAAHLPVTEQVHLVGGYKGEELVYVFFSPDRLGLYSVTINCADVPDLSAIAVSPQYATVLSSVVDGHRLVVLLQLGQGALTRGASLELTVNESVYSMVVGGVSIHRLAE